MNIKMLPGAALISALIAAPVVHADETSDANRLFVAAVKAWGEADTIYDEDIEALERRIQLLELVNQNLLEIVNEKSGSSLAVSLIIGEKVGPLDLENAASELQEARETLCMGSPNAECLLDLAVRTANEIQYVGFRAEALSIIAVVRNDPVLFAEALTLAREIEEVRNRDAALARVALNLSAAERHDEALTTAREIDGAGYRTETLLKLENITSDNELIEEALTSARQIESEVRRVSAISTIAILKSDKSLIEEAHVIALGIEDSSDRDHALNEISTALTEIGEILPAIATVQEISLVFSRIYSLMNIGKISSDPEITKTTIAMIQTLSPESEIDVSTAIALLQLKIGLVEDALITARTIGDIEAKIHVLTEIAKVNSDNSLLDEATTLTAEVEYPSNRISRMMDIAVVKPSATLFEEAISIAQTMEDDWRRTSSFAKIAKQQAKAGLIEDAVSTALQIKIEDLRAKAFVSIAQQIESKSQ